MLYFGNDVFQMCEVQILNGLAGYKAHVKGVEHAKVSRWKASFTFVSTLEVLVTTVDDLGHF